MKPLWFCTSSKLILAHMRKNLHTVNQLEVDWTSVVELLCVKAVLCLQLFLELMLHLR